MNPAAPASILCLACCMSAGQIIASDGLDPKPSISVIPDYNAVHGENLTILCQGPEEAMAFTLLKDGNVSQVQPASGQKAEFNIIGAEEGDAGEYTCHYNLTSYSSGWSESSDILDIRVRERYFEPSITVLPHHVIRKGTDLTIKCNGLRPSMRFRLYKDNVIAQQEDPMGKEAMFSVIQATEKDAGQYICYFCSRSGVTEICSGLSNSVLVSVTELPKPEISLEHDPEGSYFILCSAPEKHMGCWFQLYSENNLIREEQAKANAMHVAFPVNHSAEVYRCLYRIRVFKDLGNSPFSDSITIDKDFSSGNIFRFLLSGLVLGLIAMIIIEFGCLKKNGNWALTRQPAIMAMKKNFQKDPSIRVSLQSVDFIGGCIEDAV